MKYALIFFAFGSLCAFLAATSHCLPVRFIAASASMAFVGVGAGYAFVGPQVFLKQADGRLQFMSYLLYWPYHLLNFCSLWIFRWVGRENSYNRIDENVYLGCLLNRRDKEDIVRLGILGVLDISCEFSEVPWLRRGKYRCIPVLDTCSPSLEQLESGARWIQEQTMIGPVYVHCALGHGRSATFVAAYLLLCGQARTAPEAVAKVAVLRPKIGLSRSQMAILERFATTF